MKKNAMKTAAGLVCLAMAFAGVVLSNTGCCPGTSGTASPAKYIFLFIGDGMGATHVAAAESYKAYKNGETGFERLSFTGFPVLGMAETYSANKQYHLLIRCGDSHKLRCQDQQRLARHQS